MSSISPWCVPSAVSRSERARPLSGLHASLFHPLPALVARWVSWFVQSQFLKCTHVNPVWNFYGRRRKSVILIAPNYEFKNWFWKGNIWVSVALFYCGFTLVSFGLGSYLQAFTISGFSLKHITALVGFFKHQLVSFWELWVLHMWVRRLALTVSILYSCTFICFHFFALSLPYRAQWECTGTIFMWGTVI